MGQLRRLPGVVGSSAESRFGKGFEDSASGRKGSRRAVDTSIDHRPSTKSRSVANHFCPCVPDLLLDREGSEGSHSFWEERTRDSGSDVS